MNDITGSTDTCKDIRWMAIDFTFNSLRKQNDFINTRNIHKSFAEFSCFSLTSCANCKPKNMNFMCFS